MSTFDSFNAGYVAELYERYRQDPSSVDVEWRRLFAAEDAAAGELPATGNGARNGTGTVESMLGPVVDRGVSVARSDRPVSAPGGADPAAIEAAKVAAELVDAYRLNGHYAARLDPLGQGRPGHPTLDPAFYGLGPQDLESGPASELVVETLEWLQGIYTGTIGYEYEHLEDPERQQWLRQQIEERGHLTELSVEEKRRLLRRLTEVEALEQFLHKSYLGAKRFSIEGNDMMVPMLDLAIERAAQAGAREVVMGMAHRGRLNVLAHVLGRSYEAIVGEFEGIQSLQTGTGDVKYHLGAEGTYATVSGEPLTVTLAPNPSHLEFVSPVVEGITRAKQSDRSRNPIERDGNVVLPVLIHGDAAFTGQGVVAETLNLAELNGYTTGGTLHIIANNQIGFTTVPSDGRSTCYASDLARGFDVPIFHVNADDAEACLAVVRLALAYRERFHGDVVIDLIGYRRYGHNEGDEPAYTQPRMYDLIGSHPRVRELWAERLADQDVVTEQDVQTEWDAAYQRLIDAQEEIRGGDSDGNGDGNGPPQAEVRAAVETTVPADLLRALDAGLHSWPEGFGPNKKLARQLAKRGKAIEEERPLDWAHAESLALASLLAEGTPIRLTGQDAQRGTFSQRHLVLHDAESGEAYTPLMNLEQAKAAFEVHNSPLSELACVGFEYGYTTAAPETLVLWEAQFGDFVNGAQIIIDQFLSASRAKWAQDSGLVLLLPHGYEGQGPEHSSARMERFLQMAAEDNFRIADCTTPAQYFHLLRRQAHLEERRPLVVFTPKSLLRHPKAVSSFQELSDGAFRFVLDDPEAADRRDAVTRLVLCTGKVYYDIVGADAREQAKHVAVARVEQLYPFPDERLAELIGGYGNLEQVVWTQEEPRNMGAWTYMAPRLREVLPDGVALSYIGRPDRSSPAEGYANAHQAEQSRIVAETLEGSKVVS